MSFREQIKPERMPSHVAIIMDGNGRWAQKKGNQRIYGHKNAVKAVRDTVEAAAELGMKFLTLYAFSTENWNRPRMEIDALMSLLVSTIKSEYKILMDNNVRLLSIGDSSSLPVDVQKELGKTIEATSMNTGLSLVLALSYSSRWEIIEAAKKIARGAKDGTISAEDIDSESFAQYLTTAIIPDPDLLIRTSGEYRISNFLLFQIAYTELYFTETLWPDFRRENLYEAICDYQQRERRFGKISEQCK
jgi:undecaprenyl diphosphate synthase